MVRMRLRRTGKKKQPCYRLVVADSTSPRDGKFIENLGYYNPRTEPITMNFKEDKVLSWLKNGAQPTDVVERLLKNSGIWEKFKPN